MRRNTSYILIAVLITILFTGFSDDKFVLVKAISEKGQITFTTDRFGNVYKISEQGITKYDIATGDYKSFSNKYLQSVSTVDVSNPLKILVFYKEISCFQFIDNTLSATSDVIILSDMGIYQPITMCSSTNNGFWIYNAENSQLIRYDHNKQDQTKVSNLSQMLGLNLQPSFMLEQNNILFLSNPETGVLMFDIYGSYMKTLPLKHLSAFQVLGDNIFYFADKKLNTYNIRTFAESSFALPVEAAKNCRIENKQLFIQDTTGIKIYNIEL